MKKSKLNKYLIISLIGIIVFISILIFILNYTKDTSSLSLLEKKWLNDNSKEIINVNIFNDVPIYGYNGEGIAFDILDNFTDTYDINFNKISYSLNNDSKEDISFKVLNNDSKIDKNEILLYEDEYVMVSNDTTTYTDVNNISNIEIKLLSDDLETISSYLPKDKNISYTPYTDIETMFASISKDKKEYFAVPLTMNLDKILSNNLNVVYHINEVSKKYVLQIKDNNTLLKIMKKYYQEFKNNNYMASYKDHYLNTFFEFANISSEEQAKYNSVTYTYGYVINMPYENEVSNEFVGIFANMMKDFTDLTNIEVNYKKYSSVNKLKKALEKGEIDFAFNYYDTSNMKNYKKTTSIFDEKYVVLSNDYFTVNSLNSLKGKVVYTVSNTLLFDELKNVNADIKKYNNTDDLLRNINNNSIVVIDYNTYQYYKDKKFANYNVIYNNILNKDYNFIIRDIDKNKVFTNLFNFYLSTIDYNKYSYNYNEDYYVANTNFWKAIIKYSIIGLTIVLLVIIIFGLLMKKKKNKLTKEDKFKFIDVMTSLKNRNYLNYNIAKWDENVIYPQAIIIIDLNNIKFINDSYGHQEGDNVIIKAANILISNQLENTDIIRTDGTEFLIYLVGYNENNINAYIKKLTKELKELPYNFGAVIGYSMITDKSKTIDDAINEAALSMREQKEKQ